jgi:hypothetical protein
VNTLEHMLYYIPLPRESYDDRLVTIRFGHVWDKTCHAMINSQYNHNLLCVCGYWIFGTAA